MNFNKGWHETHGELKQSASGKQGIARPRHTDEGVSSQERSSVVLQRNFVLMMLRDSSQYIHRLFVLPLSCVLDSLMSGVASFPPTSGTLTAASSADDDNYL